MSYNLTPLLIPVVDFQEDKIIPQITERIKVEKAIREAQEFDLRPVLGDALYTDLILNYDQNDSDVLEPYVALMWGVDYSDDDGHTVHFPGLRMALKYWAYARHLSSQLVNLTSHSLVTKLQDNSQPVSVKALTAQVEEARSGAMAYWGQCVKYLKKNHLSFPLWGGNKTNPRGSFKIRVGGKNH